MISLSLRLFLSVIFVIACEGVTFFPKGKENLIWYQSSNANTYVDFVKEIDTIFTQLNFNQYNDTSQWGPCVSANSYSFSSTYSGPCIFLYFPEKFKETPDYYNSTTLPKNAPNYLLEHLRTLENNPTRKIYNANPAYITCKGGYPADEENIGPIHLYRDIEIGILPKSFTKDLIALYFEKPRRYIIINVVCTVWANFKTKEDLNTSVISFEILID